MIAIVDYGLGNVRAFLSAYRRLNIPVKAAEVPEDLRIASHIILPGVGAFDWAMERLNESGLRETLDEQVLFEEKPILGVCVGMQMMARFSEEGQAEGLGWVDAKVKKFREKSNKSKIPFPHMGWNETKPASHKTLFAGLMNPSFYFLHSYYLKTKNSQAILSTSHYGEDFTSAFNTRNIYGTQFHPEKSHGCGVQLLKNFAELT